MVCAVYDEIGHFGVSCSQVGTAGVPCAVEVVVTHRVEFLPLVSRSKELLELLKIFTQ